MNNNKLIDQAADNENEKLLQNEQIKNLQLVIQSITSTQNLMYNIETNKKIIELNEINSYLKAKLIEKNLEINKLKELLHKKRKKKIFFPNLSSLSSTISFESSSIKKKT